MTGTADLKNALKDERLARVLDEEVSPVWHNRFAQLLLQYLPTDRPRLTLELHCANGQLTRELMSRLPDQSLLVALQAEPSLDTIARAKLDPRWLARAYVRPGTFDDVTSMQDQSYDLTIANLVLGEVVPDWLAGIQELVRVTKPGGDILATMPLHGTWAEINDIFAEILREAGLTREVALLARLVGLRPRPADVCDKLRQAGIASESFVVVHERYELLFRSAREFLFSPVIEQGPLRLWRAVLSKSPKPQELIWRLKDALDTYYAGKIIAVSVETSLIHIQLPGGSAPTPNESLWRRYPDLGAFFARARHSSRLDDQEFDISLDFDGDSQDDPVRSTSTYPAQRPRQAVTPEPPKATTASNPKIQATRAHPVLGQARPLKRSPTDS